ncbi:hypothetical protein GOP47_0014997 [Adiantum capillus-veneris]|uniref:peptidylprolyl isomerase n=1 Tax=Adiantum capillus-veneris TaxID=13818 RepID=A0A9D4UMJ9_ADICA|nr:hypothetical protein GOP47_0014997 [Adiantum capillus-veneris]
MDEKLDCKELDTFLLCKEAHSRAAVLEMIGDILEAEIKPPENVLFVCKLNPITKDEDLEIIFSKFGKVLSVEIIKDHKSKNSLCYAFIEFETREAYEDASFKMNNAVIDDQRIHVDFSQSLSRLWTQYRQFGMKAMEGGKGGEKGMRHHKSSREERMSEANCHSHATRSQGMVRNKKGIGESYKMIFTCIMRDNTNAIKVKSFNTNIKVSKTFGCAFFAHVKDEKSS